MMSVVRLVVLWGKRCRAVSVEADIKKKGGTRSCTPIFSNRLQCPDLRTVCTPIHHNDAVYKSGLRLDDSWEPASRYDVQRSFPMCECSSVLLRPRSQRSRLLLGSPRLDPKVKLPTEISASGKPGPMSSDCAGVMPFPLRWTPGTTSIVLLRVPRPDRQPVLPAHRVWHSRPMPFDSLHLIGFEESATRIPYPSHRPHRRQAAFTRPRYSNSSEDNNIEN